MIRLDAIPGDSGSHRLLELDAFRGVAALGVVFFHYTLKYDQHYGHADGLWFTFLQGKSGVDLFFMISGFVIYMTLSRTRTWADFAVSRFSRLYPAYWTALILTFSAVSLVGLPGRDVDVMTAAVNVTMFQQLLGFDHVDGVYWTLQIELCFYLWMLALFLLRRLQHIKLFLLTWIAMSIVAHPFQGHIPDALGIVFLVSHIHLFALGIVFYTIYRDRVVRPLDGGIILVSVVAHFVQRPMVLSPAILLFVVAFFLLVTNRLKAITLRPFVYLGTISYSLYLLHQNIGYMVIRELYGWGLGPNVAVLGAILCVVAVASALTFLIERPAMRFIRGAYKDVKKRRAACLETDGAA
jgi:peptidoglycan/LPS O-acetylase OafA/YrhL